MAAPYAESVLVPPGDDLTPDLHAILEINRTAYDMLADTYRETAQLRQENAKKWLTQRLPRVHSTRLPTALDVGCADGTHSRVLAALGYAVTGVDFSPAMVDAAADLSSDPTLANRPTLLRGEFLAGRYVDRHGRDVTLDDTGFDLVLATAFVHLFPPESDDAALHRVLGHVAPGGSALISTTAATANRHGLEVKAGARGTVAHRWRNHYTFEHFLWLVQEAAREVYGTKVAAQPWVVADPATEKLWVDVLVTRPS